jgi:ankyrin repeat protein
LIFIWDENVKKRMDAQQHQQKLAHQLYVAAQEGHGDVVALLLRGCADRDGMLNRPVVNGETALHAAAACDRRRVIVELLQSGASPAVRNIHGVAPVDMNDFLARHVRNRAL